MLKISEPLINIQRDVYLQIPPEQRKNPFFPEELSEKECDIKIVGQESEGVFLISRVGFDATGKRVTYIDMYDLFGNNNSKEAKKSHQRSKSETSKIPSLKLSINSTVGHSVSKGLLTNLYKHASSTMNCAGATINNDRNLLIFTTKITDQFGSAEHVKHPKDIPMEMPLTQDRVVDLYESFICGTGGNRYTMSTITLLPQTLKFLPRPAGLSRTKQSTDVFVFAYNRKIKVFEIFKRSKNGIIDLTAHPQLRHLICDSALWHDWNPEIGRLYVLFKSKEKETLNTIFLAVYEFPDRKPTLLLRRAINITLNIRDGKVLDTIKVVQMNPSTIEALCLCQVKHHSLDDNRMNEQVGVPVSIYFLHYSSVLNFKIPISGCNNSETLNMNNNNGENVSVKTNNGEPQPRLKVFDRYNVMFDLVANMLMIYIPGYYIQWLDCGLMHDLHPLPSFALFGPKYAPVLPMSFTNSIPPNITPFEVTGLALNERGFLDYNTMTIHEYSIARSGIAEVIQTRPIQVLNEEDFHFDNNINKFERFNFNPELAKNLNAEKIRMGIHMALLHLSDQELANQIIIHACTNCPYNVTSAVFKEFLIGSTYLAFLLKYQPLLTSTQQKELNSQKAMFAVLDYLPMTDLQSVIYKEAILFLSGYLDEVSYRPAGITSQKTVGFTNINTRLERIKLEQLINLLTTTERKALKTKAVEGEQLTSSNDSTGSGPQLSTSKENLSLSSSSSGLAFHKTKSSPHTKRLSIDEITQVVLSQSTPVKLDPNTPPMSPSLSQGLSRSLTTPDARNLINIINISPRGRSSLTTSAQISPAPSVLTSPVQDMNIQKDKTTDSPSKRFLDGFKQLFGLHHQSQNATEAPANVSNKSPVASPAYPVYASIDLDRALFVAALTKALQKLSSQGVTNKLAQTIAGQYRDLQVQQSHALYHYILSSVKDALQSGQIDDNEAHKIEFQMLQSFHDAAQELFFPVPQDFTSRFASFAFRSLPPNIAKQYVTRGVIDPNPEVALEFLRSYQADHADEDPAQMIHFFMNHFDTLEALDVIEYCEKLNLTYLAEWLIASYESNAIGKDTWVDMEGIVDSDFLPLDVYLTSLRIKADVPSDNFKFIDDEIKKGALAIFDLDRYNNSNGNNTDNSNNDSEGNNEHQNLSHPPSADENNYDSGTTTNESSNNNSSNRLDAIKEESMEELNEPVEDEPDLDRDQEKNHELNDSN